MHNRNGEKLLRITYACDGAHARLAAYSVVPGVRGVSRLKLPSTH